MILWKSITSITHKATKTQETYKLPSGTLKLRYQQLEYKRNEELLLKWLRENNMETYIKSDKVIFARALRGRYPVLEVYKMTESNEFLYAAPKDYNYSTWEAINRGQGDSPEGSGGQKLAVSAFVMMMLMNYKKRVFSGESPWTVLIMDNPFGQASSWHVLDPIFKIADKLNFQLIAFASPEIIKSEISERFPIFWVLKIADSEERGKKGSVIGKVVHGGRVIRQ